ncbi:hypothetical protein CWI37_1563p0010 [Hamiltosporidium tvaerminnensis]|uniref:Uncharacterized protein n=1 Tax=Hamiltosporidium tvaerminnensis TaxID=1176355 RepID=A0A4Q9KXF6_9MICR|nr:hypothetical protein CWI37_1563p0010 [Hamiltosporidium tvaerminnensis]
MNIHVLINITQFLTFNRSAELYFQTLEANTEEIPYINQSLPMFGTPLLYLPVSSYYGPGYYFFNSQAIPSYTGYIGLIGNNISLPCSSSNYNYNTPVIGDNAPLYSQNEHSCNNQVNTNSSVVVTNSVETSYTEEPFERSAYAYTNNSNSTNFKVPVAIENKDSLCNTTNIVPENTSECKDFTDQYMPKRRYAILNRDNMCFLETYKYETFEILQNIYSGRRISRLENLYPLIRNNLKIYLRGVFGYRKDIADIGNNIKTLAEEFSDKIEFKIEFTHNLLALFKSGIFSIFYAKNLPIIYMKPTFLLLPIWIVETIETDIAQAYKIFYISWFLQLINATMEYNYSTIKPFIHQDIEGNSRDEFSSIFLKNSNNIYDSFSFIAKYVRNIFEILGKQKLYKIFSHIAAVDFIHFHCDAVFSLGYNCSGIPGIIFDVFILLSDESLDLLNTLIDKYFLFKKMPENNGWRFKAYIANQFKFVSYDNNENIQRLYYDVSLIYNKIFSSHVFFHSCLKNIEGIDFEAWISKSTSNLTAKITGKNLPRYNDYVQFLETCNIFLHYISKVVLNPGLVPKKFKDIILAKLFRRVKIIYFQ